MPVLAYILTWTTYGSWLHGDVRGSVDDGHNSPGHEHLSEDASRHARMRQRLVEPVFWMGDRQRSSVAEAIRDHAEFRGWRIHAVSVRTNHVHVVVSANKAPEDVVREFKSWATRRLREEDLIGARTRVWTRMGSTRWIGSAASLAAAVDYVSRFQ